MKAVSEYIPKSLRRHSNGVSDYVPDVTEYIPDVTGYVEEYLPDVSDTTMARGLGWASIGIGLAEIAATRQVEDMLGLEDNADRRGTLRVLGVREICHGISILTETKATEQLKAGVWSRVAGDMLDNVLLGVAATKTKKPFSFLAVTASVLAIGLADLFTAQRLSKRT
jgi:hypothetical protein